MICDFWAWFQGYYNLMMFGQMFNIRIAMINVMITMITMIVIKILMIMIIYKDV